MNQLISIILCYNCGLSFERDLDYRLCSNCFACSGCEIYTCPGCGTEIIVKPKKESSDPDKHFPDHQTGSRFADH